ncbi:MAG: alpha/beta hydrolase [Lentisphaeria bacterium]|nr:alpha/beta hydrolase [Lentisphaeria bacterium]
MNDRVKDDQALDQTISPDRMMTYKVVNERKLQLHCFDVSSQHPKPFVVFYFGGGWMNGNPTQFYPFSKALNQIGIQCYCAEYRIESMDQTAPNVCVEDAFSAWQFLIEQHKNEGLDLSKSISSGGSAGGHLAALLGCSSGYENAPSRPNAMILYNPVYDNSSDGYGYERVKEWFPKISPLHNVDAKTPENIVFLGSEDDLIPVSTAKDFQQQCQQHGVKSELFIYPNEGHGFFNQGRYSYDDVLEKTISFVKRIL